jgi:ethanolamine utilization protein EutM
MREALGIIETRGLVAAIEAADAMLKTAAVRLLGRQKVKGGLQAVMVAGDVASVKAATDAGAAACQRVGRLISVHVIPRPSEGIESMLPVDPERIVKDNPGESVAGQPEKAGQRETKRGRRTSSKTR